MSAQEDGCAPANAVARLGWLIFANNIGAVAFVGCTVYAIAVVPALYLVTSNGAGAWAAVEAGGTSYVQGALVTGAYFDVLGIGPFSGAR